MENIKGFVESKMKSVKLVGASRGDLLVDGVPGGEWTAEDITAAAFDEDIVDADQSSWDEALAKVQEAMDAGPGDLTKGDFDGHPFRGNQYTNGFIGLLVGKNKQKRYINTVDYFGTNYNPKKELEVKPEHDAFWNYREKIRLEAEEKWKSDVEEYNTGSVSISHAKDKNAGFPDGHPLANPEVRIKFVNNAVQELSYSNKVGYGGALKQAAQGKTNGDLYIYFSGKLPAGVSLEDVLKATYKETQGMLDEIGAPATFNLYHGSYAFSGRSEKKVNIGEDFKGFSSWSSDDEKAAGFGTHLVFSQIPRERMLIVPSQIPKQLAGVPSFLGGSRDESEYVVIHDDMIKWINE